MLFLIVQLCVVERMPAQGWHETKRCKAADLQKVRDPTGAVSMQLQDFGRSGDGDEGRLKHNLTTKICSVNV